MRRPVSCRCLARDFWPATQRCGHEERAFQRLVRAAVRLFRAAPRRRRFPSNARCSEGHDARRSRFGFLADGRRGCGRAVLRSRLLLSRLGTQGRRREDAACNARRDGRTRAGNWIQGQSPVLERGAPRRSPTIRLSYHNNCVHATRIRTIVGPAAVRVPRTQQWPRNAELRGSYHASTMVSVA